MNNFKLLSILIYCSCVLLIINAQECMNAGQEYAILKSNLEYTPSQGNSYDFKFQIDSNDLDWKLNCILNFQPNIKTFDVFQGTMYKDWIGSLSQGRNQLIITLYPKSDYVLSAGLSIQSDIPKSLQQRPSDIWDDKSLFIPSIFEIESYLNNAVSIRFEFSDPESNNFRIID